jgi:hypothetical protein
VADTSDRSSRLTIGNDLIERLLTHLADQLSGCLGVGLSSGPAITDGDVVAAIGIAADLDRRQWAARSGPLVAAADQDSHIVVDDLRADQRWPELAEWVDTGHHVGMVALPGGWSQGGLVTLTVYTDHAPTLPDLRVVEGYEPLIATSAAVVEFCASEVMRTDQVLDMVQHRRVIEQAKGIVMAHLGCDGQSAFGALVRISQQANVKLREFSVALVEHVGTAPAEQPERDILGARANNVLTDPHPDAVTAAKLAWATLREQSPTAFRPQ